MAYRTYTDAYREMYPEDVDQDAAAWQDQAWGEWLLVMEEGQS